MERIPDAHIPDDSWKSLAGRIRGEVRRDPFHRYLYSTDGSIYEIEPLGVAIPRDEADVVEIARWAGEQGVPLLPRGGGTALAGQTVGKALVLDLSLHMRRVHSLDPENRLMTVEPGIVCDEVNRRAAAAGLRWAPDPSTSNRATVGGMIGNNSSGAHSIKYGMTADCLASLRVVLADGEIMETRPLDRDGEELAAILSRDTLEARIYRAVLATADEYGEEIRSRYPDIPRNVTGYNLKDAVRDGTVDLTRLLAGSEGTLGIVTRATLKLEPLPTHRALAVLCFDDLVEAMKAVEPLRSEPVSAIELVDHFLLELAAQTDYRPVVDSLPEATRAVLAAEAEGETPGEVENTARAVAERARGEWPVLAAEVHTDPAGQKRIWGMRKAAVPMLFRMPGDPKPVPFIEDMAVAPAVLPEYVRQLQELFERHGVRSVIYAHASAGLLHVRPIINLKKGEEVEKMSRIAADACRLVLSLGGAMAGEHGDGLSRTQWVRVMYGDRLWQAFREVKAAFDPGNLLNPGKITAADTDLRRHLRYGDGYREADWDAVFDFSDQGGFQRAVELCNGCGGCRKNTGTMCPTFQAMNEEIMSTRGRANLIRGALGGRLDPEVLFTPEFRRQVLDYCIGCKGCRVECPSGVDLARIKAEVLHHYNRRHGLTLRRRALAHVRILNRMGSATAPLSNWLTGSAPVRALMDRVIGIDRRRSLPRFARTTLAAHLRRQGLGEPSPGAAPAGGRGVLLFPDCFNNFNHPRAGIALTRVLRHAGVEVRLAPARACCGRPMISEGLLDDARRSAETHVATLLPFVGAGWEIVTLEPSCTAAFRQEFRELLGLKHPGAKQLAERTWESLEYLAHLDEEGALEAPGVGEPARTGEDGGDAGHWTFHAHCHQKAIGAHTPAARILEKLTGRRVDLVDAGCCGMAGSFGYKREHSDFSARIAENVRRAVEASGGALLASGTSCTSQFRDLYGWEPRHPVEAIERLLRGRGG